MLFLPGDRRCTFFFWLGIIVLPVFWAWLTLQRSFARWQRVAAFSLAAAQVILFWHTYPQMTDQYAAMIIGLPAIWLMLTLGLFGWLLIRVGKPTFAELVPLFLVVGAQLISLLHTTIDVIGSKTHWSWQFAIMPLAPALLILAADPEHRVFKQVAALLRR